MLDRADQTYAYLAARAALRAGGTLEDALQAAAEAVRQSGVLHREEAMVVGWSVTDALDDHRAQLRADEGRRQEKEIAA